MTRLRFTRKAEADIVSVHDYTVATFGALQWATYGDGLRKTFENLRLNPLLGSDRSAVKADVRRLIFRSHVIYYRLAAEEILVLRIIGVQQDPGRHL